MNNQARSTKQVVDNKDPKQTDRQLTNRQVNKQVVNRQLNELTSKNMIRQVSTKQAANYLTSLINNQASFKTLSKYT